ncbi:FecCD family ABC transporter permease [Elusimicrobiota bacterium]
MKINRNVLIFSILFTALITVVIISLGLGGSDLSIGEIINSIFKPDLSQTGSIIVWKLRIPRIVLAMFTGMGLAVSGCVFQGMLKNPLADPYTLGISGGAALGATLGIVTGLSTLNLFFLPLCAFIGTFISIFVVYVVSSKKSFSNNTLILVGVILGFVFSSLVILIFTLGRPEQVQSAIFWLMGDLSSPQNDLIGFVSIFIILGVLMLFFYSRELNILTLGHEKAMHLGVETEKVKKILFITASFVTAACVSATGIIGFVGLIIPHFLRKFTGPDHRILIPASAIGGAIFLTLCDAFARTIIAPIELPVGVITGFIGGIVFLIFIIRSKDYRVF